HHVADLLDARMRVGQRPLALLDLAEQHLDLLGADRVPPDEPAVQRADVVGRVIAGHLFGTDEVAALLLIPHRGPPSYARPAWVKASECSPESARTSRECRWCAAPLRTDASIDGKNRARPG